MIPAPGDPGSRDPDKPVRVMLVDDSAVIRRVVTGVIDAEPGLEVAGSATNGREALDRVDSIRPHVVVLDVEMPELDGLATLRAMRPRWPLLPVIMFSTLTSRAAAATLDALSNGASDYATKPQTAGSLADTMVAVRDELVPRIRSWGAIGQRRLEGTTPLVRSPGQAPRRPTRGTAAAAGTAAPTAERSPAARRALVLPGHGARRPIAAAPAAQKSVEAVVIGSSAGGPNALAELVPQLPADLPVPVLLTQHMPETFTALLANRLDATSALRVVEAEPGMVTEPGHLYVAKGGAHLTINRVGGRTVLDFDHGRPENYCRPAVDVMFRSAARAWGSHLLAVVLTGMGRDGVDGARAIVAGGGTVLTQDEETCLVWGMPGAVTEAGLSSASLPLDRIAAAICQRVGTGRSAEVTAR